MPAYRCSICSINYPANVGFRVCPNCDDHLDYFTNVEGDVDWRKTLEMRRAGLNVPVPKAPETPLHDTDAATVIYDASRDNFKVSAKEIADIYGPLQAWDVVKLNGKYYELENLLLGTGFWEVIPINVDAEIARLGERAGEPFFGPSSDDIKQVELDDGTRLYWDPREDGPEA